MSDQNLEKITCLAFPSLQFTPKILKLSISLLDKLGHIQVKHADIYNMEIFQDLIASKRNQEAELGR